MTRSYRSGRSLALDVLGFVVVLTYLVAYATHREAVEGLIRWGSQPVLTSAIPWVAEQLTALVPL